MGFRFLMRRDWKTYVNSQSAGTLAAPSASTVVLAVHTGPAPSPTHWPVSRRSYVPYSNSLRRFPTIHTIVGRRVLRGASRSRWFRPLRSRSRGRKNGVEHTWSQNVVGNRRLAEGQELRAAGKQPERTPHACTYILVPGIYERESTALRFLCTALRCVELRCGKLS